MASLKDIVSKYRQLEAKIEEHNSRLVSMKSALLTLLQEIGRETAPGERRLLRIGNQTVLVDNPIHLQRGITIETVRIEK